jgi:hypothetical protein
VGKLRRGVPSWLQAVIAKATEKRPDQRFESAGEIADILEPYLNDDLAKAPAQTMLQIPLLPGRSRRGSPSLFGTIMSFDWVGFAPRIMFLGLVGVFMAMVINLSKPSASTESIESVVEKKSQAIGRFVNNLDRLNKVVVQTVENQDKFEEYLKQQEAREKQAASNESESGTDDGQEPEEAANVNAEETKELERSSEEAQNE